MVITIAARISLGELDTILENVHLAMQRLETYPSLRASRERKSFNDTAKWRQEKLTPGAPHENPIVDRIGFFVFIASSVALMLIVSFYFLAERPDHGAINITFDELDRELASAIAQVQKEEAANPSRTYAYMLPDNFAALRGDPKAIEQHDSHLMQVRFVANVIRDATRKPISSNLAKIIVSESKKHGYDPLFVTAVIMAESRFDKKAISPVGALGLMQLLPSTAQYVASKLGIQHWKGHMPLLHDEAYNIKLGVTYLKYLDAKYNGNKRLTLAAYNWGPGNLQKSMKGSGRLPAETVRYRDSILKNYTKWSQQLRQQQAALAIADKSLLG